MFFVRWNTPPFPQQDFIVGSAFYDASVDLTFGVSYRLFVDYAILAPDLSGWSASVDCEVYFGDVLVQDPKSPDLIVDPFALPICTGALELSASRTSSLAVAAGSTPTRFSGRFQPLDAAPRAMRLERGAQELSIAVADVGPDGEVLRLRAPLAANGQFVLVLAAE